MFTAGGGGKKREGKKRLHDMPPQIIYHIRGPRKKGGKNDFALFLLPGRRGGKKKDPCLFKLMPSPKIQGGGGKENNRIGGEQHL